MATPTNINSKSKGVSLGPSASANTNLSGAVMNNLTFSLNNQPQMDELQVVLKGLSSAPNPNVPNPKLRQIRIYLCSTFSDFKEERNIFWSDVLPELQQHCLQYGVDVLLFDPFQGYDADTVYHPHLFQLQLEQIRKCRSQSEGVFFVCFVGDKYGPCPLPLSLKTDEFIQIKSAATESGKDAELLNFWYKIDQNCIPPVYTFQETKNRKFDEKTFHQLTNVIRNGFKSTKSEPLNNQNNTNSDVQQNRLFTSCVEQSIQCALENWKCYHNNCLFITRTIDVLPSGQHSHNFDNFVDDESNDFLKPSARENLLKLKSRICQTIDKPNIESFKVLGSYKQNGGSKEWEKYLEKFTQQMIYKLKQLIDRNYASGNHWSRKSLAETEIYFNTNPTVKWIYEDVWHHYQALCNNKCLKLFGQSDTLSKLKDLCKKSLKKPTPPIILQGDDGIGKTNMLCEVATLVKTWLGSTVTVMLRFINLNAKCKFAHELLRSLCIQICVAYDFTGIFALYKDCYTTDKIVEWFDLACSEASKLSDNVLVVIIDDLHLLKYAVHAGGRVLTTVRWIPALLPRNVVFLATTGKNVPLERLPLKKADSVNFVQMQNYKESELIEITKSILNRCQKTITGDQETAIKKVLKQCSNPLYATLLGVEASNWSCYHTLNGQGLPTNIGAFVDDKLEKMEKLYGYDVCSNFCTYLECAHYGLTETEVMDLLNDRSDSRNEQTIAKCSFFLCSTWLLLKDYLSSFLSEKISDGRTIFTWSHPVVSSTVRYRYLRSSLQLKKCHTNIANLYRSNEPPEGQQSIGNDQICYKFLLPQPLWIVHPSTGELMYNRRCAQNLWYHLLHSGSISDFEEQSLCNFTYLVSVLNVTGLAHLITIMEDTLLQLLDHNLHILYGMVIRPSVETLSYSPNQFASELIGRLNYTRSRNTPVLNALLDQAMSWVDNDCTVPLLVPLTCWIKPPLCPLVVSFQLQDWIHGTTTLIQPTINYQHLLVAGTPNGRIWMYHILTNTIVKTFTEHTDRVLCLEICHNGQCFATSSLDNTVRMWDLQQGSCIRCINLDKVLCMLFTFNDEFLFTGSSDGSVKMICVDTGQVKRAFIGHTGPVNTLAINNQNEYLISGSSDFVALVWNIESGQSVSKLGGLMAPVLNLGLTSNDTFLLVACADETLRVYSLCLAKELHELRGHEGNVCSMVIGPDDCQVFAGTSDGNLYCYDLHTGQLLSTQNCHTIAVTSLKITKDGHFLISACAENIHVWNIDRPTDFWRQENTNQITVIALSRDFKYIAAGNTAGVVYLWDLEYCQCVWATQDDHATRITHLSFDNEVNYLFTGAIDGTICVWSMVSGYLLRRYKSHTAPIRNVQIFSDRVRILSHDSVGVVKIWHLVQPELDDEDKEIEFRGTGDLLRLVNDKDMLANAPDVGKEIRIWNVATEDTPFVRAKLNHNDIVTCMVVSNDSKFVVTGSQDQSLKVWEVATGYLTQILVGHEGTVVCCTMNDDCQVVVSGAADKTVFAWEVETGSILSSFSESNKDVTSVAVTADGYVAFSGYKDGWLHAWATESGRKIASFNAHLPILEVLTNRESHRIVLRLDQCPKVAIVCLHNCPAFGDQDAARRRKRSRALSISSLGSSGSFVSAGSANIICAPSSPPLTSPGMRSTPPVPFRFGQNLDEKFKERLTADRSTKERKTSKVFATIEHSRSRGSIYDSTTSGSKISSDRTKHYVAPVNQNSASKVCVII